MVTEKHPKIKRRSLGEFVVKRSSSVVLGPETHPESKVDFESSFSARSEGDSPKVQKVQRVRKLQSQGVVVLSQSVSLQLITSSGATYRLRAKSRKEVDAAATAKTKCWAKHGDRKPSESKTIKLIFFLKQQMRFVDTAVFPEITQFLIVAVDEERWSPPWKNGIHR